MSGNFALVLIVAMLIACTGFATFLGSGPIVMVVDVLGRIRAQIGIGQSADSDTTE